MLYLKPNAMQMRQALILKEIEKTLQQNELTSAALAASHLSPVSSSTFL